MKQINRLLFVFLTVLVLLGISKLNIVATEQSPIYYEDEVSVLESIYSPKDNTVSLKLSDAEEYAPEYIIIYDGNRYVSPLYIEAIEEPESVYIKSIEYYNDGARVYNIEDYETVEAKVVVANSSAQSKNFVLTANVDGTEIMDEKSVGAEDVCTCNLTINNNFNNAAWSIAVR